MIATEGILATVAVCTGEETLLDRLCEHLGAGRFEVLPARSAADALRLARHNRPDLMVLDTALPEDSAFEVMREIREADGTETGYDPYLPILALVEPGDGDRTRYLDAGADDCLARPFAHPELRARIGAVLRRRHSRHDEPVRVGGLTIDPARRLVTVGGREIRLANKEFTLLRVLASDPTRVFSKDELLHDVWGLRAPGARARTLDSHASRLRRRLAPDGTRYVVNCWGVGYSLVEPGAAGPGRGDERQSLREFAGRVRRLMEAGDLTPAALADRARLDRPTVEAILAARHPVWIDEIHLLAGALGVTPAELVDGEGEGEGEDR